MEESTEGVRFEVDEVFNKDKVEDLQKRVAELKAENAKLSELGAKDVLELEAQTESLSADASRLQELAPIIHEAA